jgi:hypothetical protein
MNIHIKSDAFDSVTNSLFAKEFPRSLAIATAKILPISWNVTFGLIYIQNIYLKG